MNLDVTSVDKQPEPYGLAAAAIEVITNDEIRRSGASNIPEALRLADNLDVAQVGSSNWDISARGFNSSVGDKLLVLIDGRSVYTPLFSGVIWGMQDYPLEDIDRIEVISGPGGTMWGANAVNGVINISSKSAKDTQGFYLETGGGSQSGRVYRGALWWHAGPGYLLPCLWKIFRSGRRCFSRRHQRARLLDQGPNGFSRRRHGFL